MVERETERESVCVGLSERGRERRGERERSGEGARRTEREEEVRDAERSIHMGR